MPDSARTGRPFVLLDWDNTLHDAAGANFAALRDVLAGYGLRVTRQAYRRAYTVDYRELYHQLGLAASLVDEASRRWRARVIQAPVRLLPGVGAGLARLAAGGYRLGLVTSSPRAIAQRQVDEAGLGATFAACVFGDRQPPRPDPAPLHEALGILGAAPGETAFCSDTTADMTMARAAGVRAVGIASFAFDAGELLAAGAEETAPSFAEWVTRQPAVAPAGGTPPGSGDRVRGGEA
jgi:HAD superfamily hydrolase (TIGR01509 family)